MEIESAEVLRPLVQRALETSSLMKAQSARDSGACSQGLKLRDEYMRAVKAALEARAKESSRLKQQAEGRKTEAERRLERERANNQRAK